MMDVWILIVADGILVGIPFRKEKLASSKLTNRRLENPPFWMVFTRKDGDFLLVAIG